MDTRAFTRELAAADEDTRARMVAELIGRGEELTGDGLERIDQLDAHIGALASVRNRTRRHRSMRGLTEQLETEIAVQQQRRDAIMLRLVSDATDDAPAAERATGRPPSDGPRAPDPPGELARMLVEVGERMGLRPETGYEIPGGRLDVVWLWDPPTPVPGLVTAVPVVAFAFGAGDRTPENLKSDLLDLLDAGCAVGVLVDAGAGSGTGDGGLDARRRFTLSLVDRPGPRMLVWSAADVAALHAQRSR